jgi:hypothetical protein
VSECIEVWMAIVVIVKEGKKVRRYRPTESK